MMSLRRELIRLAHQKPELRKHLLPILRTADVGMGLHDNAWMNTTRAALHVFEEAQQVSDLLEGALSQAMHEEKSVIPKAKLKDLRRQFNVLTGELHDAVWELQELSRNLRGAF